MLKKSIQVANSRSRYLKKDIYDLLALVHLVILVNKTQIIWNVNRLKIFNLLILTGFY